MKRSRLRPVSAKTRTQRWPALKAMREAVLRRAKGKCEVCGRPGRLDCHHIVKRSQRGADTPDNVAALCRRCHARTDWSYAKGRLVISRWRGSPHFPLASGRYSFGPVWGVETVYKRDKWA